MSICLCNMYIYVCVNLSVCSLSKSVYCLLVRAELISVLVFRKKVIPPEVVIRSTMMMFHKGLSSRLKTKDYASAMVARYEITGQWFA